MSITTPYERPFAFDDNCRGAVNDVSDGVATIVVSNRAISGGVLHRLGKGSLLAACGRLYRILEVGPNRRITYEAKPVDPPTGVAFVPHSLTIPAGGEGDVDDLYIDKVSIVAAGKVMAKARVGVRTGSGPEATVAYVDSELHVGDDLTVREKHYRVLSIVPPEPAAGLPGWLEVDTKPTP
jgi:hypothetical protein